jgi:16S rRNA processing protein RimM
LSFRDQPPYEAEPAPGQVAVGRVLGPWGVRGHVKVEPMTDFLDRFEPGNSLNLKGKARRILDLKQRKQQLLVQLQGIATPEAAKQFSGSLLTVDDADLPALEEGEFYRFQLLGLEVVDEEGNAVGKVAEILDTGETQVLVVRDAKRQETLVPMVSDYIQEVALDEGQIRADLRNIRLGDSF